MQVPPPRLYKSSVVCQHGVCSVRTVGQFCSVRTVGQFCSVRTAGQFCSVRTVGQFYSTQAVSCVRCRHDMNAHQERKRKDDEKTVDDTKLAAAQQSTNIMSATGIHQQRQENCRLVISSLDTCLQLYMCQIDLSKIN